MGNADRLIDLFSDAIARPAGAERERFMAEACLGEPRSVLHYVDGRQYEVPIIYGQDLREGRHGPAELKKPAAAPVIWSGRNPGADSKTWRCGSTISPSTNVWPDTPIASLEHCLARQRRSVPCGHHGRTVTKSKHLPALFSTEERSCL